MATVTAAVLEPVGRARIVLESVDIQASLRGLFSEVAVTQVYGNLEDINIEAVYTFPLPLDAVLLDLALEINGKTLRGLVQPKLAAEERYEDAVADGDSTILLQQVEPGIFTLNIGNILPNEKAIIRFRYGQLHRWQGDRLRFHLPTTIAPRYGDPAASGLAPHQVPEYALSANHGFSLSMQIEGELARADFECPSYPVAVSSVNGVRTISFSGGSAVMDRDFVLVLKEPEGSATVGFWVQDGEEYLALASFHPRFRQEIPASSRCVKLVVDCSGSMGGDSIAQARAALHEILSLLEPGDFFNLITFGSSHRLLFPQPVLADDANVRAAAAFVDQIDANMGGTEIGAALTVAYDSGEVEGLSSDLLLITDGEVWGHELIVDTARKSGHRIFTVGVGSAVSEAFVRGLADATAGACELVSPRENMADRIVGHFQRIDQPMADTVKVVWPSAPIRQTPDEVRVVFVGDTLHVFGWLDELPAGEAQLVVTLEDGRTITSTVALCAMPAYSDGSMPGLARIAAYRRLPGLDVREAADLASQYQLVTEQTSCVLVFEREEERKSGEVPALRKVPQVIAAGWGGTSSVDLEMAAPARMSMSSSFSAADPADLFEGRHGADALDLREFNSPRAKGFGSLVAALNNRYPEATSAKLDIQTVRELVSLGLEESIAEALSRLITQEITERDVVAVFLVVLSSSEYGRALSRHVRRLIRMEERASLRHSALDEAIRGVLNHS